MIGGTRRVPPALDFPVYAAPGTLPVRTPARAAMFAESAFDHVLDTNHWHFFHNVSIHLPFGLTKYKILMLIAAGLILAIYLPIAKRAQSGEAPRGRWWNCFESILTFIRDNLAKPYLGHHADHYVAYLWTVFLFILFCNLLGMIPFMGSPTASIMVTGALALVTFLFIHGNAILSMGPKAYYHSYFPHIEFPAGAFYKVLGFIIVWMIAIIELVGNLIKAFVLAVRLFANIFAGHVVLAFILFFIVMVRYEGPLLFWGVTFSSVLGVTLLSLLELFVAFLQAFVFTFLTALFLGMALHPQH
jgi:F-type H+-transporting ATPase subunit a